MNELNVIAKNAKYSVYGDPYRHFAHSFLFTSEGRSYPITIPFDLGRNGRLPFDLFLDEWLGLRRFFRRLYPAPPFSYPSIESLVTWTSVGGRALAFSPLPFDVITELISQGSFQNVMKLAKTRQLIRFAVQRFIRVRIQTLLQPFIHDSSQASFLETVAQLGGCIVSNLPTAIMSFEMPHSYQLLNLHVVIAKGKVQDIVRFLTYTVLQDDPNQHVFTRSKKPDATRGAFKSVHYLESDNLHISIFEANHADILRSILTFTNTGQFNILTINELVCFYPRLLRDHIILDAKTRSTSGPRSRKRITPTGLSGSGFRFAALSRDIGNSCGPECPILWRDVTHLKGIGAFNWLGLDKGRETEYALSKHLAGNSLSWRLNSACYNELCGTSGCRGI
ncbi:hypothetical protein C8J56DRAFT_1040373 [Mycena floridula]|nr:hypothetical protein C8J56DRAFT_1040373 [Mycena floridula]